MLSNSVPAAKGYAFSQLPKWPRLLFAIFIAAIQPLRKRTVAPFGLRIELGEVLEIIPEISTELSDYGTDGDHYGRRTTTALA